MIPTDIKANICMDLSIIYICKAYRVYRYASNWGFSFLFMRKKTKTI